MRSDGVLDERQFKNRVQQTTIIDIKNSLRLRWTKYYVHCINILPLQYTVTQFKRHKDIIKNIKTFFFIIIIILLLVIICSLSLVFTR